MQVISENKNLTEVESCMSSILPKYEQNGIILEYLDTVQAVYISGTIDLVSSNNCVENYLMSVHSLLQKKENKELVLDITGLKYLNSTGIAQIINWILSVELTSKHKQYHITIKYTSRFQWQESSVSTFVSLNDEIVSKERC